jgi:hypothetical protein
MPRRYIAPSARIGVPAGTRTARKTRSLSKLRRIFSHLKILRASGRAIRHPSDEAFDERAGCPFDPAALDRNAINRLLARIKV